MKKRLHGCPEALVSPEVGDAQTADSTETTSDPESTSQVENVELTQGRCNTHRATASVLLHVICTVSFA